MGKHLLRDDKECQNCGRTVEENYCPKCGQKNTETRQSFSHLVAHFLEDLTHYDGAFWKTLKYLMFRPALLTKEYLIGKRQCYVPPVKLYIFISFLTFFIPAVLPDIYEEENLIIIEQAEEKNKDNKTLVKTPQLDKREMVYLNFLNFTTTEEYRIKNPMTYKSLKEMDSIENLKPDSLRLNTLEYKMGEQILKIYAHNTPEQVGEKFKYAFFHNVPKALFVYLPIFAFWLWLFHGKKRWYFFDHSIFTLHYFSFLLLSITLIILLGFIADLIDNEITYVISFFILFMIIIWQIYYFYRAHRNMYCERMLVNILKSTMMFFINIVSIIIILLIFAFTTLYTLH